MDVYPELLNAALAAEPRLPGILVDGRLGDQRTAVRRLTVEAQRSTGGVHRLTTV